MGVEVDDLISAGWVGLCECNRTFREGGGRSFKSHAHTRIVGAMKDWLRSYDWATRSHRKAMKNGKDLVRIVHLSKLADSGARAASVSLQRADDSGDSYDTPNAPDWVGATTDAARIEKVDTADLIKAAQRGFDRRSQVIIGGYLSGVTMREIGQATGYDEARMWQLWREIKPKLAERFSSVERIGSQNNRKV